MSKAIGSRPVIKTYIWTVSLSYLLGIRLEGLVKITKFLSETRTGLFLNRYKAKAKHCVLDSVYRWRLYPFRRTWRFSGKMRCSVNRNYVVTCLFNSLKEPRKNSWVFFQWYTDTSSAVCWTVGIVSPKTATKYIHFRRWTMFSDTSFSVHFLWKLSPCLSIALMKHIRAVMVKFHRFLVAVVDGDDGSSCWLAKWKLFELRIEEIHYHASSCATLALVMTLVTSASGSTSCRRWTPTMGRGNTNTASHHLWRGTVSDIPYPNTAPVYFCSYFMFGFSSS